MMFLLDRRHVLQMTAAAGLGATLPRFAHAAVEATELYTGTPEGGNVDSVVVVGERNAVLIDTQFTPDNASALADLIEGTGRQLETVFITHAHPDHYSGLPVIRDRFPDLRAVAHPMIQPLIPVEAGAVEALDADHIMLEGERLEILDPMHGDTDMISAVHIPALDTLVAADFAYVDTHVWVAENTTAARLDLWRASLDQLEAMGAGTVIPGHRAETSANDASVFAYTRAYLDVWQDALGTAGSAEELTAIMMAGREDLGLAFAVQMAVGAAFPE
jgi:glyoxylase-like metal-dependent hydrolase (beta-lactamase superfamily II)